MKATGIVRRIDEFGRIVIPREIRSKLRINVGEPVEIFVQGNEVILKKHSIAEETNSIVNIFVENIKEITDATIIITDRDKVIAISKEQEKYLGREISEDLTNFISKREPTFIKNGNNFSIIKGENNNGNYIIAPNVLDGDYLGVTIVICDHREIDKLDEKIAHFVSKSLINYLEKN